jgi:hypothetical protein
MFRSLTVLPLLFQTFVLSRPMLPNEQNVVLMDYKNVTQLDPDTFGNSITYCSPLTDHTPCTETESPDSGVHHYLNASHTAHFECFFTDPVVGSVFYIPLWFEIQGQADTGDIVIDTWLVIRRPGRDRVG